MTCHTRHTISPIVFGLMSLMVSAGAALAASPAYVGTWGTDAKQCANPQDIMDAPMILTTKGYDQHETHCSFGKVTNSGGVWSTKATCSVEGDKQTAQMSFAVKGNVLTLDPKTTHAVKLKRC